MDVPCILTVTSYKSVSLRPSLPLYIDGSHCTNSSGCPFDVLAEQSCSVLTHLKITLAWNPEHDANVNQSINTSTLPVHVFSMLNGSVTYDRFNSNTLCIHYEQKSKIKSKFEKPDASKRNNFVNKCSNNEQKFYLSL